jgi:N-methylhydantoinase A
VLQPAVDVTSIGAGGGSIAWFDAGGALHVGPQSAEADPGPVCFGKGGTEPTVTDAQLVLGRINPDFFLGQRMQMHVELARTAIQKKIAEPLGLTLQEAAAGMLYLANTNMINAIRERTIERGFDPRDFTLLCFGGGGGLFAGALAQELEIPRALIPPAPAVFSAWGILNADFREDVSRTSLMATAALTVDELEERFNDLEKASLENLRRSGLTSEKVRLVRSADMRYAGQQHTVRVPVPSLSENGLSDLERRFDEIHERTYEHALPGTPTEIVNLRVAAIHELQKPSLHRIGTGAADSSAAIKGRRLVHFEDVGDVKDCRIYDREKLAAGNRIDGPAIVEEWNSTVIVLPEQNLEVDTFGNLIIHTP